VKDEGPWGSGGFTWGQIMAGPDQGIKRKGQRPHKRWGGGGEKTDKKMDTS